MQSNAARAGLLVALAAVAVALFIVLSNDDDSASDSTGTTTATATAGVETPPSEPSAQSLRIELRDGAPVGGVAELEVTKGETVKLAVTSDEDAEFHIHGYEIERQLAPGEVTRVTLQADIDGKFEVEAHSHTQGDIPLAELTVQPG
jgi:FtsP/CotA-like multicopper oxidase with cupredoxin domain